MKLLVVSVPSVGHVRSMAAVARVLVRRGHAVHWAANESVGHVRGSGATLWSILPDDLSEDRLLWPSDARAGIDQWMIDEWFVPVAERALVPTLELARRLQPDLIVADSTALWAPMVAEALELPWASYCPGLFMASPARQSAIAEIQSPPEPFAWARETGLAPSYWQVERRLNALRRTIGLPAASNLDAVSPMLVLCFTTRAIELDGAGLPPQARCVGPVFASADDVDPFPDRAAEIPRGSEPLAYVTLGNVSAGAPDLPERLLEAVEGLPVRAVVAGLRRPAGPRRAGVAVADGPVSQRGLLRDVSVVIGAGGFNTVHESLCHGVPVVALPVSGDEPALARRIEELGLGVALEGDADGRAIREAATRALEDSELRRRVAAFAVEASIMNGASRAALLLEEAAGAGSPTPAQQELLAGLPERPRWAPRFRLVDDGRGLRVRSSLEDLGIEGDEARAAVRWLAENADGGRSLPELLELWSGDGGLVPVVGELMDRGVLEDTAGSVRLSPETRTRYADQIVLFSHAYARGRAPHPTLRGNDFQERLLRARVCVSGSGVLASNVARHLCLVGVGTLGIVAGGVVTDDLIARGGWFRPDQVGTSFGEALAGQARAVRPDLELELVPAADDALSAEGAAESVLAEAHLLILAEDGPAPAAYGRLDSLCQRLGVQWTSVRRSGMVVEVGPTVVPGQTACFHCFEQRRAANDGGLDGGRRQGDWLHLPGGADLVVVEAVKLLTGFGETASLGRALVLDPLAMTLTSHRVLRLPDCPRCGAGRDVPRDTPWRPLG